MLREQSIKASMQRANASSRLRQALQKAWVARDCRPTRGRIESVNVLHQTPHPHSRLALTLIST